MSVFLYWVYKWEPILLVYVKERKEVTSWNDEKGPVMEHHVLVKMELAGLRLGGSEQVCVEV